MRKKKQNANKAADTSRKQNNKHNIAQTGAPKEIVTGHL
jgi:hypothetical protein